MIVQHIIHGLKSQIKVYENQIDEQSSEMKDLMNRIDSLTVEKNDWQEKYEQSKTQNCNLYYPTQMNVFFYDLCILTCTFKSNERRR